MSPNLIFADGRLGLSFDIRNVFINRKQNYNIIFIKIQNARVV